MFRPLLCLVAGLAAPALIAVDDSVDGGGRRAGFGAFLVRVPLELQAELDLVPGEGLMVLGVRPNSTASGLGLGRGDVVLELNHQDIHSRRDVRAVVRGSEAGDPAVALTAAPDGGRATARGEFQERVRRPPGGWRNFTLPPPDMLRELLRDNSVEAQNRRLVDEAALYGELAGDLQTLRQTLAEARLARDLARASEPPWRLDFACAVDHPAVSGSPAEAASTEATEVAPLPTATAVTASWRLRFDLRGPGDD